MPFAAVEGDQECSCSAPGAEAREVVDDLALVGVLGPSLWRRVVRRVLDRRVGAQLDQERDQLEVAVEGGLVERVGFTNSGGLVFVDESAE